MGYAKDIDICKLVFNHVLSFIWHAISVYDRIEIPMSGYYYEEISVL